MATLTATERAAWRGWEKILFRFFFIYFLLFTAPFSWLPSIPVISTIHKWYNVILTSLVTAADRSVFHVHWPLTPLPANDGAGDTSHYWAELWLFLSLSLIGCIIWSIADRHRKSYRTLGYWFRTFLRYYIALIALSYGLIKIFALQMPAPNLSQLATPLGDFGPMRLCWMFMGYSGPYEIFSGLMEIGAGLLLLYRRTTTLGLLLAAGVFINVMMLNLCYDIPVKLFSIQLVFCCLFLLVWDYQRLFSFLALNRSVSAGTLYDPVFSGRRMRICHLVFKLLFIYTALIRPLIADAQRHRAISQTHAAGPIREGIYNVNLFVLNGKTIPQSYTDTVRWKDLIFDRNGRGSVNCPDTMFASKYGYGRGLFYYDEDTLEHRLRIKRSARETNDLLQILYEQSDSNTVRCWTRIHGDSLYMVLQRTNRHFQLENNQFHWISESNR